jgi:DNA-binding NtrC family response regulator
MTPVRRALRVVHSPDATRIGQSFSLDGDAVTIGRVGADGFADTRISREHFIVTPAGGAVRVADLGSTNGTFLMGTRIQRELLVANAVLRAGDTLFVLDEEPPPDLFPASPSASETGIPEFVGVSFAATAIRRWLATAGPAREPVLVLGASGTGKEVVARALHRLSERRGPWVAVNCAAISPQIADAELFGHRRGAFTGAEESRPGLFMQANRGSLFLDEIGDLPVELQAKLLRVIEEKLIRPVGDSVAREADVRVLAATNADLGTKGFRDDLRGRLSTWLVELPPIADRRADILPLARYFAAQGGGATPTWSCDFAEALLLHDWPLNARELERLIQRLCTVAGSGAWDLTLLPNAMQKPLRRREGEWADGEAPTRTQLEAALKQASGNVARVAELLGRDRAQIYRWLRRHGLEPDSFRAG